MAPKTITGRIVEKEGGSMTEELRNRLRCLQHLPVTCQFEVAEIHLREPVVCKETLAVFQGENCTTKENTVYAYYSYINQILIFHYPDDMHKIFLYIKLNLITVL